MKFDPQLKDFLAQNKNISLMGFFWSMYWRWTVLFGLIFLVTVAFIYFLVSAIIKWPPTL